MLVSFLRHAEAEDVAASDFDRRLTENGERQARAVGKFCARTGTVPELILASPLARAEETARIVADAVGGVEVVVEQWLASGMGANDFFEGIGGYKKLERVMVVGHEPDFSETISAAVGCASGTAVHVRKASLTLIDFRVLRSSGGRIEVCLPVRLMAEREEKL